MAQKKEEWQSTDSGYLNCIGVGDTYVKKQIARILNQNELTANNVCWFTDEGGVSASIYNFGFKRKEV